MHDTERWWEADENYFWKEGVSLDNTISTFIQLFEQLGFTVCLDFTLEKQETVTNCHGLKMKAPDGKMCMTDVVDTEQLYAAATSLALLFYFYQISGNRHEMRNFSFHK